MSEVLITNFNRDEGTIVLFDAIADNGLEVTIAVDHRMARPIVDVLDDADNFDDIFVEVESWQVIG